MDKSNRSPNILFLFSDQFNARCLSCADHPDVKTPNLDRLAEEGFRFENAYAQSPICTPSRISYLSGLYPSTHGYHGLYGREPEQSLTSMFRYFKEMGYRTGALGKLHTPRYWIERDCQFVYDEFIEYPKYLEGAGLYDENDNRRFTGWRDGEASTIPFEHSCEVALAKQAVRFICNQGEPADRGDPNAPWFAWVSFARPHSPITPSEPYASMYYALESITLPPSADPDVIAKQPDRIREVPRTKKPPQLSEVEKILAAYLGLVSQVDYGVGLVLEELEKQGILDDTIIVFASDHGDYAGEHGLWSKIGGISSRAITRVPLILRLPGKQGGGEVIKGMVEAIDLFPSLCELAKLPIPDHVQGISFSPLLENPDQTIRDSALTENAYRKAIATPRWRYVANTGAQPDELYDQLNDPWEVNNLIDDPEYLDVSRRLLRQLLSRVATARRPVTLFDDGDWRHEYDRDGRTLVPMSYNATDTHL
jgi:arylsulfatase A-like enzyme